MDSAPSITPLPTRGTPFDKDLLRAFRDAMKRIEAIENACALGQTFVSPECIYGLFRTLRTAVGKIPFHPRHYVPEGTVEMQSVASRETLRQHFEKAQQLRFRFVEGILLKTDGDGPEPFDLNDLPQICENLTLMKLYVQTHMDHLAYRRHSP